MANHKKHNVRRSARKWNSLAEASWGKATKEVKQRRLLKKEASGVSSTHTY